jgi:hypothetical protein
VIYCILYKKTVNEILCVKFVDSLGVCRFYLGLLILRRFVYSMSGFVDSKGSVASMRGFVDSMAVGRFCWVCRFYVG